MYNFNLVSSVAAVGQVEGLWSVKGSVADLVREDKNFDSVVASVSDPRAAKRSPTVVPLSRSTLFRRIRSII